MERSFDGGVCLGDGLGDGLGMRDTLMTSRSRELDDMSSRSTGGRHRDAIVFDPSDLSLDLRRAAKGSITRTGLVNHLRE